MVPRAPRFILLGLLTIGGIASAACDKVPLVAPAGTVITLVTTTNVLPLNGSTDVVAVLIENGTTSTGTGGATSAGSAGTAVHNGTLVTFTTSLGRIEPAEARTTNGRVTVKLIADGRSGKATVTAFSGSATKTIDITIGAAAAERVLVTANPTTLPSIGGTSTISARVEDTSGNPLLGVPVAFTTTAGTLTPVSAVTNEAGLASTSLSTTTAATVTATAGGKTGTAALTLRSAATLTLTVPTGTTFVGSPVAVTVAPSSGATISNVVVNFDDGNLVNLGTISSQSSAINSYDDEGVFVVRATGRDADGASVSAAGSLAVVGFAITASAFPSVGPLGTVTSFTVSGVPTTVPVHHVDWDFGNGQKRTTNSLTTSHEYSQRGRYVVTVTVHFSEGPPRTATIEVSIT